MKDTKKRLRILEQSLSRNILNNQKVRRAYDLHVEKYLDKCKSIKEVNITNNQLWEMTKNQGTSIYEIPFTDKIDNGVCIDKTNNLMFDMCRKERELSVVMIKQLFRKLVDGMKHGTKHGIKSNGPMHIHNKGLVKLTPLYEPNDKYLYSYIEYCRECEATMHPVEYAVMAHNHYLELFPTHIMGNAHLARIIMNFILIRKGYLPHIVTADDIVAYEETVFEDVNYGGNHLLMHVMEEQIDNLKKVLGSIAEQDSTYTKFTAQAESKVLQFPNTATSI